MTPRAQPIKAGDQFIGFAPAPFRMVEVNLTSDAAVLANADVAFEAQVVTNAARIAGGSGIIRGICLIDIGDNGTALDLVFFDSAPTTLGTENAVVSITDAQLLKALGHVNILTTDYTDLVANQIATKNCFIPFVPIAGTRDIYVGGVVRGGTPTYPATGTILRLFIEDH